MEITPDKLVQIIGSMQIEIMVLREENARLRSQLQKDAGIDNVKPLHPSSA